MSPRQQVRNGMIGVVIGVIALAVALGLEAWIAVAFLAACLLIEVVCTVVLYRREQAGTLPNPSPARIRRHHTYAVWLTVVASVVGVGALVAGYHELARQALGLAVIAGTTLLAFGHLSPRGRQTSSDPS